MGNFVLLLYSCLSQVENLHKEDKEPEPNSDNEVAVEDMEWLDYLTKEGLMAPDMKNEVDKATLVSKWCELKSLNKQLGKTFRNQKRLYKELLQSYEANDLDTVKELSRNVFQGRLDLHKKLKSLNDTTVEFTGMSTGTCFESLGNIRPRETVELKKRIVNGKMEFGCTECKCWKGTRGACQNHLYITHGVGGFECPFCDYITGNSQSLYVHTVGQHDTNIGHISMKL